MAIRNLDDLLAQGVSGRGVLVRSDLNVPLNDGAITDPGRIIASVPTIKALADAGAKVVVTAHLGTPRRQAGSGAVAGARRRETRCGTG